MGLIVFVTTELYPFTAGGIGRVLFNTIKSMTPEDRRRTVIVPLFALAESTGFSALFRDVRVFPVKMGDDLELSSEAIAPTESSYDASPWHWRSYTVFRALAALAGREVIDYVEFPDWGGLAYSSLQAKKAHGFLNEATLAIRLHASHSVLLSAERYVVGSHDLNLFDLERKSLRDCDLIIAQIAPYAEVCRKVFGFDRAEWDGRLIIHSPPVLLDGDGHDEPNETLAGTRDILFTSKFQHIKRPDLFVRGVGLFFGDNPDYEGRAVFCAHNTDGPYIREIDQLIPEEFRERFVTADGISQRERNALISASIVVITGNCESFCLAAYEASLMGAIVCLNEDNPAFGSNTPWQDGVNCFKFAATATSLAQCLVRASRASTLNRVVVPISLWPWDREAGPIRRPWKQLSASSSLPLVTVVIAHRKQSAWLIEAIQSISCGTYQNLEFVVVDDLSSDFASQNVLDLLSGQFPDSVSVYRIRGNIGPAAARNFGVSKANGDYILIYDADDVLHPDFVRVAVTALENNLEYDLIGGPVGFFDEQDAPPAPFEQVTMSTYEVFIGEAVLSGLRENRFGRSSALIRRCVFDELKYDESLRRDEDWAFYMAFVARGFRMIMLNEVYFFHRRHSKSVGAAVRDYFAKYQDHHSVLAASAASSLLDGSTFIALCDGHNGRVVEVELREKLAAAEARLASFMHHKEHRRHTELSEAELDFLTNKNMKKRLRRAKAVRAVFSFSLRNFVRDAEKRERLEAKYVFDQKLLQFEVIKESNLFDSQWYLEHYPDVLESGMNPIVHYLKFGASEGRDPSPYFSSSLYLRANPDVWESGLNPLLHYIRYGRQESRQVF